jgi:murein L,D-transpeptidase YafK
MRSRKLLLPLLLLLLLPVLGLLAWTNLPDRPLAPGVTADRVLVEKAARRLTLLRGGKVVKTYRVSLGGDPVGQKLREGDRKTPEGLYPLDFRKPRSCCHRSLHVGYPDSAAAARARAAGAAPGGDIMIHGLRNGLGWLGKLHRLADWT